MHFAFHSRHTSMSQHITGNRASRFKSISLSVHAHGVCGVYQFAKSGAVEGWFKSQQSVGEVKVKWHPALAFFSTIRLTLYIGAVASDSFENKGFLTEQALLLLEESLSRLQAFDPTYETTFAAYLLLHWKQ